MTLATDHIRLLIVRELRTFAEEVQSFPDDASLWQTVPGVSNSVGNLASHVCGNLQHYVGRVLGGTHYQRNRALEFSRRSGTRADVLAEIDRTIAVVDDVLPRLPADVLEADYPEALNGRIIETGLFLLQLAVHASMHLGQAGYLRRMLTGDPRSASPVSLATLGRGSS